MILISKEIIMLNLELSTLTKIALWIIYIIIPLVILYISYLVITKAFDFLGFSPVESFIIIFFTIFLGLPITIFGYNISNFSLFNYNGWIVAISTAGALIPTIISIFLIIKNKLSLKELTIALFVITIVSFIVTHPEPSKGIISHFPYWILPGFAACLISIILCKKNFKKGASMSYSTGVIGVLIGADFLHLPELLTYPPTKIGTRAIIGGAIVLDMVFITGIIAVLLYGLIMFRYQKNQ